MDNNDPTTAAPAAVWMNWGGNREYEIVDSHFTGWRRQIGGYHEFNGQLTRPSTDPCQNAKHERRYERPNFDKMLRHSGGRCFDELCALVGRTAEVTFGDYGCSGDRVSWTERVTIASFWGSIVIDVYDEEGCVTGCIRVPHFEVRDDFGNHGIIILRDLADIQPPDRVSQLCFCCRGNPDNHAEGCPEISADPVAASDQWWKGRGEYFAQRNSWAQHSLEPTSSDPSFQLGHQSARWWWSQTQP